MALDAKIEKFRRYLNALKGGEELTGIRDTKGNIVGISVPDEDEA